ncbi:MAG: DUF4942 domain-containing protein [Rhodocyclaceae bacterium]|nr:MAG: DUF4942 domain-containing protein [Rhodocyclaceae bacterium]
MTANALTSHHEVVELVAAYEQAEREVRAAFAALVATEERLNAFFTLAGTDRIRIDASGGNYRSDFKDPDDTLERMARGVWQHLIHRLELRRFMSVKAFKAFEREVEKEKPPPVTVAHVVAFVREHRSKAREYLTESVHEVFDWLRPRGHTRAGQLVTNTELEVGRRVIVDSVVSRSGWTPGKPWRVDEGDRQMLIALERVLYALDGQGEILKGQQSELQTAIADCGEDGRGETPLFRFRVCRNRSLHLEFKRIDLLARFNALAGGTRLRPKPGDERAGTRSATYPHHDDDDRQHDGEPEVPPEQDRGHVERDG